MRNKFDIFLDLMTIEIKYSYGQLYWDRCGQTLLDIETQCDGWFSARDEKNTGRLENPEKNMILVYNDSTFNLSVTRPDKLNNDIISDEAQNLWKIVRANFGLEEYDRIGFRQHFLKPTTSMEQSESLIKKSEFNINIPDHLKDAHYDLNVRHLIGLFDKEDAEYRVELKGVVRSQSIDPRGLYQGRPETLSKNQKEYRQLKMKQIREYSTNPMYAVMLDIDCAQYNPERVVLGEYITEQTDIVRKDFLPILEKL